MPKNRYVYVVDCDTCETREGFDTAAERDDCLYTKHAGHEVEKAREVRWS
jgi:hypothetical protein